MTKNIIIYGLLLCCLIMQTSCIPGNTQNVPVKKATLKIQPSACADLLSYNNKLAAQTDEQPSKKSNLISATKNSTKACLKLREAIELSIPGSDHQSNSKALALLKDLKRSKILIERDQQFSNLLLQHISQRQKLHQIISTQKNQLKKIKIKNTVLHNQLDTLQSQLNQLKNIEVEIDKKERSVTSPIGE